MICFFTKSRRPNTTTTSPEPKPTKEPSQNKTNTDSKTEYNTETKEPPSIPSLQEVNAALRSQITQLQSDLHDAQDFVFSLQPRHQILTEAEAVEEFTALCAAVEDWVDQKLGDDLDKMNITSEPLRVKDIQNIMDLIPPAGKAAFNIPNTDVDNIQAMILRYLNDVIFSQEFYCPLPPSERQFIMTVERSMRGLQPKRDIRACRHWRIETYTAASDRPGFSEYATDRMWGVTIDIIKMLRIFAPSTDANTLAKSFFESITKPACAFARKMHLCFDEYTLEWSGYHDKQLLDTAEVFEEAGAKGKYADYGFVELNSRKFLRDRPVGEDGEPLRVRWLFDLSPRLVFRKLKADSWTDGKVLVKPVIVVYISEQRKGKRASKKKEEHEENTTVLGALGEWLHSQQKMAKPAGFFGIF
ncbi:hypothetical protein BDW62DRAFT_25465 [Aspergillus aurantiobrunneus]